MRRAVVGGVLVVLLCLWGGVPQNGQAFTNSMAASPHPYFLPVIFKDYHPIWVWGSAIPVQVTPAPRSLVLALDGTQAPHLLWDKSSFAAGAALIYHTTLTAQGWTTPAAVSNSLDSSDIVNPPTLGSDGRLHLLWRTSTTDGHYHLMYSAWNGEYWSQELEFIGETQDPYPTGTIAVNAAGEPGLAGTYNTPAGTAIAHWILHFGWLEGDPIPVVSGARQVWPDRNDGMRIYLDDPTDGSGQFEYWKSGSLQSAARLSQPIGDRTGRLDGANNLHLFRLGTVTVPGGSVTGLLHQCLDKNLTWGKVEVVSAAASLPSYPSEAFRVVVSPQGNTAAAYLDSRSGAVGVLTWDGCRLATQGTLVTSSSYSGLDALAFSEDPNKLCVIRSSTSSNEGLFCAALKY